MSKNIKFKNDFDRKETGNENKENSGNDENDQLHQIAPTFVLCVRDFSLHLAGTDDKEMSADEYLKDCLQLKQPSEDDDQHAKSYNRTRQCVVKYFPVKTCFTFDRPGNRDVLREMDTAQEKDLSKTFLADTKAFLSYVYKAKPKRMLHSKSINGAIFADLLQSYVKEIQSGKVHDVDDAFTVAANNENERMMEKAIEIFKEKLQSLELPMLKVKTFGDKYLEIQRVSLTVFGHKSVFNAERFIGMAKERMKTIWQEENAKNLQLVTECIWVQLSEYYENIVGDKNKYMVVNGTEKYDSNFEEVLQKFKMDVKEVDANVVTQVIRMFKDKKESTKKDIIAADKKLTDKEAERKCNEMKTQKETAELESAQKLKDLQDEMISKIKQADKEIGKLKEKHEEMITEQKRLITQQNDKLREQNEKAMQRTSDEKVGESQLHGEATQMYDNRRTEAIEIGEEFNECDEEDNDEYIDAVYNVQDDWEEEDIESLNRLDSSIARKNDETRHENTEGPLAKAITFVVDGVKTIASAVVSITKSVFNFFFPD